MTQIHDEQLSMNLAPSRNQTSEELWLGLTIDHRQLFDALQDEWLLPSEGLRGRMLGVCAFAEHRAEASAINHITVRLMMNAAWLPLLEVPVRRKGQWTSSKPADLRKDDEAVFWPGAMPTFAIGKVLVSTSEERARLTGLARQVSNVALPETILQTSLPRPEAFDDVPPPSVVPSGVFLPPDLDAVRGAIAMAVASIPRVDPWLDLLVASLGPDPHSSRRLAAAVAAPWWVNPPWLPSKGGEHGMSLDEHLWIAAAQAFQSHEAIEASALISRIASGVQNSGLDRTAIPDLNEWVQETNSVLRADSTVSLVNWRTAAVRKAIQLVLLRPDPTRLLSWRDDLPELPPAVWWSAATLCGLLHGYRRLEIRFRGDATQRRLLTLHSLNVCRTNMGVGTPLLNAPADKPDWRREQGGITFLWGGERFGGKPEHPRSLWYVADLNDPAVKRAATDLSRRLRWPCLEQEVLVTDQQLTLSGSGEAELVPNQESRRLKIRGSLRIRLPLESRVEESLDGDGFRHCLVTEGGANLPEPPTRRQNPGPILWTAREPDPAKLYAASPSLVVPGLRYVLDFVSPSEEKTLVSTIDAGPWLKDLQRRVQHYGWRYDYRARQIDRSMHLGPLPEWAAELGERLLKQGLLKQLPDQVIVNEYVRKQGITRHVDCVPCFADGIAMVSLLESWEMIFTEERGKHRKVKQLLDSRSVAVMDGPARYEWAHEIPKRLTEPSGLRRLRRISLTFRKVDERSVKPSRG